MVLFLATKILFLAIMEKKRALIMSTPEIHVEANFLPRSDQQGNSFYSMLSIVSSKKIWEESIEIHVKDIILINANVWVVGLRNV